MGVAGLRTMMLLREAGHDVLGFEARQRTGGRLHTIRSNEGFYEAGGEWIDADHHRTLALLRELQGEPITDTLYPGTVLQRGKRYREGDYGELNNKAMERVEEEADRLAIDLDEVPWHNALYANFDQMTLGGWLDQQAGKTSEARRILEGIYRSDEGEDTSEIGLLGWLIGRLPGLERTGGEMSSARFPNGAQGFCDAMVPYGGPIKFGCALQTVMIDGKNVGLVLNDDYLDWFDQVILALPAGCLRDITFEPGISEAKQAAFDAVHTSRTIKIALHFEKQFWSGSSRHLTDGALQQVWNAHPSASESGVTLLAYLGGEEAIELALLGEEEAGRVLVEELEIVLPGAKQHFVRATLHDWVHDDFSGGGFFSLPPGYVLDHYEALVRSEGPIHFVGDFAGRWIGTIEGALESAERVAETIKRASNVH